MLLRDGTPRNFLRDRRRETRRRARYIYAKGRILARGEGRGGRDRGTGVNFKLDINRHEKVCRCDTFLSFSSTEVIRARFLEERNLPVNSATNMDKTREINDREINEGVKPLSDEWYKSLRDRLLENIWNSCKLEFCYSLFLCFYYECTKNLFYFSKKKDVNRLWSKLLPVGYVTPNGLSFIWYLFGGKMCMCVKIYKLLNVYFELFWSL